MSNSSTPTIAPIVNATAAAQQTIQTGLRNLITQLQTVVAQANLDATDVNLPALQQTTARLIGQLAQGAINEYQQMMTQQPQADAITVTVPPDTIGKIAQARYGDWQRYRDLLDLNHMKFIALANQQKLKVL